MRRICQAPAKINLFLFMTGYRNDGYHLLSSVMQTISLYDEITVEADKLPSGEATGIVLSSDKDLSCPMEKNTAYRAADLFFKEIADGPYDVKIRINKTIPSQAGLGGGSSDAASVLLALNDMFPDRISNDDLSRIALSIGADVPFFLSGGTVLCEGVGEILHPGTPLSGLPVVILKPVGGVSTKDCYARFDAIGKLHEYSEEEKKALEEFLHPSSGILPAERIRKASGLWGNDLEKPAMQDVPAMKEGIGLLKNAGAVYAAMSGSGSAVFGIFESKDPVQKLLESEEIAKLKNENWFVGQAELI